MGQLRKKLEAYNQSDYYPFHMPGHKRNANLLRLGNPYEFDITEIEGFDNLHLADGILKEMMEDAAAYYGAQETYFLVNGSTAGLLIGMAAATNHGDTVLVARNCHRAVYHGIFINELNPIYIYPQEDEKWGINGPILPEDVDKQLKENSNIKLVVITSPTYEGVVSDIIAIAEIVHRRGAVLMVDEAHGAHFGTHPYFPESSLKKGADLVIHSVHKTLPAFTQSALLHRNSDRVKKERIALFFSIYQSSSPSYLLMMGIEEGIGLMKNRSDLMEEWVDSLQAFYKKAQSLKRIQVLCQEREQKDPSKLILSVRNSGVAGPWLYHRLLDHYHLQMEAECVDYVIGMTSIADTKEGFYRLEKALEETDAFLLTTKEKKEVRSYPALPKVKRIKSPYEAELANGVNCELIKSAGKISKEYIFLYPPGIPLLVPGEQISKELLMTVAFYRDCGLSIKGLRDKNVCQIVVIGEQGNG